MMHATGGASDRRGGFLVAWKASSYPGRGQERARLKRLAVGRGGGGCNSRLRQKTSSPSMGVLVCTGGRIRGCRFAYSVGHVSGFPSPEVSPLTARGKGGARTEALQDTRGDSLPRTTKASEVAPSRHDSVSCQAGLLWRPGLVSSRRRRKAPLMDLFPVCASVRPYPPSRKAGERASGSAVHAIYTQCHVLC